MTEILGVLHPDSNEYFSAIISSMGHQWQSQHMLMVHLMTKIAFYTSRIEIIMS